MIFRPIEPRTARRRIVFVTDAGPELLETTTEHGAVTRRTSRLSVELLLHACDDAAIYTLVKPKQLASCLGYDNWTIIKYHNRVVRLIFRNAISIYPFSTFGPDWQALMPFFDALRELGVQPSSMSTMVANTWLRLLPEPVWLCDWGNSDMGRRALHGGRKEARIAPASFSGVEYLDMRAAYLHAMREPIPTHLRQHEPIDGHEGIIAGSVRVPELPWGPLPFLLHAGKRRTSFYQYGHGRGTGIWPVSELELAISQGAEVPEVRGSWVGYRPKPIFGAWLPWALALRTLSGPAGLAAKMLTTRLWSLFAVNPASKRQVVTFTDRKGLDRHVIESTGHGSRFASVPFVAAIIASRVRQRLYRELLTHPSSVYCDTDGGIVTPGLSLSGWSARDMVSVEIKAAQAYRWECAECGEIGGHPRWHYSVAGFPSDSPLVEGLFRYAKPGQLWDLGPSSLTLPAGPLDAREEIMRNVTVLPAPLEEESL